jgi:hypothetical protein
MNLKLSFIPALTAALTLSACSMPKISVPKVKIPFVGESEEAPPADDPVVPFDPRKPLTYGCTLKLTIYRGVRDTSKVYSGSVMVDREGLVKFKAAGQVKLAGLTVPQAAKAIQSAFGRKNGAAIFHTKIEKVEAMPLVTVNGAVRSPGAIQWFDGLTVSQALNAAGGHDASAGRAVYVIREGVSRFHGAADNSTLEPGDTVSFSSDL